MKIWWRIFFLLRKWCIWGTKVSNSSKRSRKGTNTAKRCGPHDGSSGIGGRGSSTHGFWGTVASAVWLLDSSPEQLNCSHNREKKPSNSTIKKSWKREHFQGRMPRSRRNLKQNQKKQYNTVMDYSSKKEWKTKQASTGFSRVSMAC